jgi:hypothetical protein
VLPRPERERAAELGDRGYSQSPITSHQQRRLTQTPYSSTYPHLPLTASAEDAVWDEALALAQVLVWQSVLA